MSATVGQSGRGPSRRDLGILAFSGLVVAGCGRDDDSQGGDPDGAGPGQAERADRSTSLSISGLSTLASVTRRGAVTRSVSDGSVTDVYGFAADVVAFGPNDTLLATNDGPEIVLIEQYERDEARRLVGHGAPKGDQPAIVALSFSSRNGRLASLGGDGQVIVWDYGSGQQVTKIPSGDSPPRGIALSYDGAQVAVSWATEPTGVLEISSASWVQTLGRTPAPAAGMSFDTNGHLFVAATTDPEIGPTVGRWLLPRWELLSVFPRKVTAPSIVLNPLGPQRIAFVDEQTGDAVLWIPGAGGSSSHKRYKGLVKGRHGVALASYRIYGGSGHAGIRSWDVESGEVDLVIDPD